MDDQRDARLMTDRELLLGVFAAVEDIKRDIYGNGQPGLLKEFESLKTTVNERTVSKGQVFSLNAAFTAALLAVSEFMRARGGQ